MNIHARMTVRDLMNAYPEAEEVLADYDIEIEEEDLELTLVRLCRDYGLSYWELKDEILEARERLDGEGEDEDDDDDYAYDEDEDNYIDYDLDYDADDEP